MRSAAVYSCASQSNSLEKETLIHEQLEEALATLAKVERRIVANDAERSAIPGLAHVKANEAVVALGRAAHTVLADFQKRTLISNDLDLEGSGRDPCLAEDIEQLVWSCANTLRIVALGDNAWQSIQLLPIGNRRFYNVPPVRIMPASGKVAHDRLLVINHDADDARAGLLADVLQRSGFKVERTGVAAGSEAMLYPCWSDESFIHVHVGDHSLASEELRLVDSWRSDRLALQLVRKRGGFGGGDTLMIEDEVNGFICESASEIVTVCRDVLEDRVLQRKILAAGQNTVAPLVRHWLVVAEDLLA